VLRRETFTTLGTVGPASPRRRRTFPGIDASRRFDVTAATNHRLDRAAIEAIVLDDDRGPSTRHFMRKAQRLLASASISHC
jgi:hypothetical protein